MPTVRELLHELESLQTREHVWCAVREFLEGFLPEGNPGVTNTISGVNVPDDVLIDIINEVDNDCLAPIRDRIRVIEGARVGDENGSRKELEEKAKRQYRRKGN